MKVIIAAAVKGVDGKLYSLPAPAGHSVIINLFGPFNGDEEQGFLTSEGEFVGRKEARVIAMRELQIVQRVGCDQEDLFSENLWSGTGFLPEFLRGRL